MEYTLVTLNEIIRDREYRTSPRRSRAMGDRAVPHVRKFLGQRLRELRKHLDGERPAPRPALLVAVLLRGTGNRTSSGWTSLTWP